MAANSNNETSNHHIPLDLQMEIFSWLPAKSLMRFKCVSKKCCSFITNPVFAEMYQTRKRAAILAVPPYLEHQRFLLIDTTKKPTVHEFSSLPYKRDNLISNIVDGLVCFYSCYECRTRSSFFLYNLATREGLHLPSRDKLLQDFIDGSCISTRCFLGFDPNNVEYKVLHCYGTSSRVKCEVYTLGGQENRWKPINIPGYVSNLQARNVLLRTEPGPRGFCHNGVIYWLPELSTGTLAAFNVEHEMFDFIEYPPEKSSSVTLAQIGGDITLVADSFWNSITLWRLQDPKVEDIKRMWVKEVIAHPFPICTLNRVKCTDFGVFFFVRSSTSDQFTVERYDLATRRRTVSHVSHAQGRFVVASAFCPLEVVEKYITPLKNIGRHMQV